MSNQSNRKARCAAAVLAVLVALAPAAARAETSKARAAGSDFGIGVVTVLANLGYMPVKIVYGVLGGVTGGFAYVLTGANRHVADEIWVPALGGDYVLTTEMMKGRQKVHFSGVRPAASDEEDDGPAAGDVGSGSNF